MIMMNIWSSTSMSAKNRTARRARVVPSKDEAMERRQDEEKHDGAVSKLRCEMGTQTDEDMDVVIKELPAAEGEEAGGAESTGGHEDGMPVSSTQNGHSAPFQSASPSSAPQADGEPLSPVQGRCALADCDKDTPYRCARCGSSFYCTRAHQRDHWPTHQRTCEPQGWQRSSAPRAPTPLPPAAAAAVQGYLGLGSNWGMEKKTQGTQASGPGLNDPAEMIKGWLSGRDGASKGNGDDGYASDMEGVTRGSNGVHDGAIGRPGTPLNDNDAAGGSLGPGVLSGGLGKAFGPDLRPGGGNGNVSMADTPRDDRLLLTYSTDVVVDSSALAQMMDMGFSGEQSSEALKWYHNNVARATEFILSGGSAFTTAEPSSSAIPYGPSLRKVWDDDDDVKTHAGDVDDQKDVQTWVFSDEVSIRVDDGVGRGGRLAFVEVTPLDHDDDPPAARHLGLRILFRTKDMLEHQEVMDVYGRDVLVASRIYFTAEEQEALKPGGKIDDVIRKVLSYVTVQQGPDGRPKYSIVGPTRVIAVSRPCDENGAGLPA